MTNPQQQDPVPAVRLIFEYEGDAVRLVSQQPVDTTVSDFETGATARPGDYVVETRDDHGERLARVPARGAFRDSAEVFPEDQQKPITRVDVEARGAFTVVVPAPAEAAEVAVVHVEPPEREPRAEDVIGPPAEVRQDVDLATFRLER
ncbi:hypothetical protein [Streptomyces capillispiralis]|uniref:Uncharacterized protein n=1 Tax=Streptomyces capillispiralis TaxID=68182 RepID=A0A561T7Z1_9ACTN|nr:hypothetical protein [Streptomyces capillispiralis]TWF83223.1 hypothetical protein FHX78_11136 [Streptomyces capillispiralis]GHH94539.1 hypothetical protein GCM10017779_49960 [Streptomyces capillispiralis]